MEKEVIQKIFKDYESVIVVDSRMHHCTNDTNMFITCFLDKLSKDNFIPEKINNVSRDRHYYVGLKSDINEEEIAKTLDFIAVPTYIKEKIQISIHHPAIA